MGFIDWLTKDNSVKTAQEEEEAQEVQQKSENEYFDEDFDSLRELANNERMETAEYEEEQESQDFTPASDFDYFEPQVNNYAQNPSAAFTIFKVADEEDVRQVLKHLSMNFPCIATFENVKKKDFALVMKYLQGGLFVLGANMSEWQKDAYILVPKGMAINMQEKSRRKRK